MTHPKTTLLVTLILTLALAPTPLHAEVNFTDLTQNAFYDTYINYFSTQHFIQGDTDLNGNPTGEFRPDHLIKRSEFAKLTSTFTLAEEYGEAESWKTKPAQELTNVILKKLQPYFNCNSGACESIGGKPFPDVKEREYKLCQNAGDAECDPWYGPYVYHATGIGRVKGYLENGIRRFKPNENILRLHALKMMMVDNGNIPPLQDSRFQRLTLLAQANTAIHANCLVGAESYILNNNQNNDPQTQVEAQWLLEYALLADKLGLFGSQCEAMAEYGAYSPEEKANFLQKPITRKEVMRYFGFTTSYRTPEPEMSWEEYQEELKEEELENQESLEPGEEDWWEMLMKQEEESWTEEELLDKKELLKDMEYLFDVTQNPLTQEGVMMTEYPTMICKKSGTCLLIESGRPLLIDKVIEDRGKFWQQVIHNGEVYRIDCQEIRTQACSDAIRKTGEDPVELLFTKEENQCKPGKIQELMIKSYLNVPTEQTVREIWTSDYPDYFKFYMQLGLDLAKEEAKILQKMMKNKTYEKGATECNEFKFHFMGLYSGHSALEYRKLDPQNYEWGKELE